MLAIPRLLEDLLAHGRWPRDDAEARAQEMEPLATPERVRALAPGEGFLYLLPPPFRTVREDNSRTQFWDQRASASDGIDFDLAVVVGCFGPDSDAPILLDYRGDPCSPQVIRLQWAEVDGEPNRWVIMAPDFQTFVEALGL